MEIKEKRIVIIWVIILIFLVLNFITTIETFLNHNKDKQYDTEHWKQVEDRIVTLEMEVQRWKN